MIKRKKNPHNDLEYFDNIVKAISIGEALYLSNALCYYRVGMECKDCGSKYDWCDCEGDINGGFCKECGQFYCVCNLPIWNKDLYDRRERIRKFSWLIARKTLNKDDYKELVWNIIDNHQGFSIFLDTFTALYEKVKNNKLSFEKFLQKIDNLAK